MTQERIHSGSEFLKEFLDQQSIPIKTRLLASDIKGIEGFMTINNHLVLKYLRILKVLQFQ